MTEGTNFYRRNIEFRQFALQRGRRKCEFLAHHRRGGFCSRRENYRTEYVESVRMAKTRIELRGNCKGIAFRMYRALFARRSHDSLIDI